MPRRRFDLAFRPASYWPTRSRDSEVEIVRITLSAQTRDAFVLSARRDGRGVAYQMVHEDVHGPTRQRIRIKPTSSARPLTLGEMVALLESACFAGRSHEGDERFRGVIWGNLQLQLEQGHDHADDYLSLLTVSSPHYRQLERYFGDRLDEWCLANCIEEEDCGKIVRLATGRFPRKLVALE